MKIYHNPRCSKSRQTLQLLEDAGHSPEVVLYLQDTLNAEEIKTLICLLGFSSARDLMRKGEADYKALSLKAVDDEEALIEAMVNYPKLIERPIVVSGQKAVLGRPPENVKALF